MARRFAGSRGGLQAPKRQIANDGVDASNTGTITMGANVLGQTTLGFVQVNVPALTLVRTRGAFRVDLQVNGAIRTMYNGAYGIIVVSNQAVAAGIGSLPLPLEQIENDWVVYVPFCLRNEATAGAPADLGSHLHLEFDSRGMRKLKDGESLAGVVQIAQDPVITGTVIQVGSQFRMQFKL